MRPASPAISAIALIGWQAALIGKPWALQARGPEAFDCYGLVEHVWQMRAGVDLSLFRGSEITADPEQRPAEFAARTQAALTAQRFIPIDQPRPLAIGVVRYRRFPVHVGLYAFGGHFVHACEDSGCVRQDEVSGFRTRTGSRLTGWYWPAAAASALGGATGRLAS